VEGNLIIYTGAGKIIVGTDAGVYYKSWKGFLNK
jgi:hypothetical protein